MALLLGCVSQDENSRSLLLRNFDKFCSSSKHLHATSCEDGTLVMACASPATMPVSIFRSTPDAVCAVFGAVNEARAAAVDPAVHLATLAAAKGAASIGGRDGYYAAVYKAGDTVTIGTDPLGYYPLYWYSDKDVVLFASAPGLFTLYPGFRIKPSAEGIAAVLMTMHLIGSQSVLEGVRRLPGGKLLQIRNGGRVHTFSQFTFAPSQVNSRFSERDALDAVDAAFDKAIDIASRTPANIMLSGGMDSRLIAGAYRKSFKGAVTAVTFGKPADFESFCAGNVARALSMQHVIRQDGYDAFPRQARKQCWLERSSNSLANLNWDAGLQVFNELERPVLTGLVGDAVMGASHVGWAFDRSSGTYSFDHLWREARKYGVSDESAERLLAPLAGKDLLHAVKEEARSMYDAVEGEDWQKAWMFDLQNRQRFHVVSCAWRLSLMAWPELPFYSLPLLELMSSIPYELQKNRQLQRQLLISRYTRLAKLPLDRNARDIRPLIPSLNARWLNTLYKIRLRLSGPAEERRTYFREYDMNNAGWRQTREMAESSRVRLRTLLHPQAVDELLPALDKPVQFTDAIVDSAGIKSMLGLALSLDDIQPF